MCSGISGQCHGQPDGPELGKQTLTHPLVAMLGDGMGNLVPHDDGKPVFIFRNGKQARVDGHLPPGMHQALTVLSSSID